MALHDFSRQIATSYILPIDLPVQAVQLPLFCPVVEYIDQIDILQPAHLDNTIFLRADHFQEVGSDWPYSVTDAM